MTIAIDKLYLNKMPNSCKECPLTYLDTGNDAYFGANERRCVIDDSCVDGMGSERAYDCPLVEVIPKDEYENRLKADMAAMLIELKNELIDKSWNIDMYDDNLDFECYYLNDIDKLIQQKIDKCKAEREINNNGNDK